MNKHARLRKFLTSFWFWWLLLFVVYSMFNFTGHPIELCGPGRETIFDHFVGFVGLFVPFGILSIWYGLLIPLQTIVLAVLFFGYIRWFQEWLSKTNYPTPQKIFLIFVGLFVATIVADMFRMLPFESFKIFIRGYIECIT